MTPAKKVLYVENGIGYGGAIICLRHLVRNLDRSKYHPIVVTGRTGPQYEDIAKEAQWVHIRDRHLNIAAARERLENIKWIKNRPLFRRIASQVLARADDVGNFLPFLIRLLWVAKTNKVDLIHANNEPLCNRAALLAGKILRVPTICHVRGNQDGTRLMRWAYSLPDYFVPVSFWVEKNIIENLGVSKNKTKVVYDGLELEKLDINSDGTIFREKYGIPKEAFAVGLVGLLIPWKGQEIFLDAATQLKQKIPNLKMVIVGGTPEDCVSYERKLKKRVSDEGLTDTVIFTGHVDEMPIVYNGLDVVVSASTKPEPLGTMVIETLAMGRPLIAPNHGGGAEMVEHGVTGLLFEPGDANELATMIQAYYEDRALRQKVGRNGRIHALKTFGVREHAENIQSIYDMMLRNGHRPPR